MRRIDLEDTIVIRDLFQCKKVLHASSKNPGRGRRWLVSVGGGHAVSSRACRAVAHGDGSCDVEVALPEKGPQGSLVAPPCPVLRDTGVPGWHGVVDTISDITKTGAVNHWQSHLYINLAAVKNHKRKPKAK